MLEIFWYSREFPREFLGRFPAHPGTSELELNFNLNLS